MRRYIILGLLVLFIAIGAIGLASYFASTHSLSVSLNDAKSAKLLTLDKKSTVATFDNSGSARVANDIAFILTYTANEGFSDGSVNVEQNAEAITVTPDFSTERYKSIIASSMPEVTANIKKAYPNVEDIYTITPGAMKDRGEWFTVKLLYKGEYDFNSDNLKLLLHKKSSGWELSTKPEISFSTADYPDIPQVILSWANEL